MLTNPIGRMENESLRGAGTPLDGLKRAQDFGRKVKLGKNGLIQNEIGEFEIFSDRFVGIGRI